MEPSTEHTRKLLAFGYWRSMEIECSLILPIQILQILIPYIALIFKWMKQTDKHSKYITCNKDIIECGIQRNYQTAFHDYQIETVNNKYNIHEWKLKFLARNILELYHLLILQELFSMKMVQN